MTTRKKWIPALGALLAAALLLSGCEMPHIFGIQSKATPEPTTPVHLNPPTPMPRINA